MPPVKGTKQRNFPAISLQDAIAVPRQIQDQAAGRPVTRITLADLLGRSPGSTDFERIVTASRMFGLTTGGSRSEQYELTGLGARIASDHPEVSEQAQREAILNVAPYEAFLRSHNQKRVPAAPALKDFLTRDAEVAEMRAEECMDRLLTDARFVGFITVARGGGEWIQLESVLSPVDAADATTDSVDDESPHTAPVETFQQMAVIAKGPSASNGTGTGAPASTNSGPASPRTGKVFIAHGKNHGPLEQLKKMLDQFKVPYAVAVDEPHAGRPIGAKVAHLMRDECSSGIFIFTADEMFLREGRAGETEEVWRPSENVVYELGAASILYENRIVIFKEDRVTFPSDFSALGHITFQSDQLGERMGDLFGELVKLDILEVRAKA